MNKCILFVFLGISFMFSGCPSDNPPSVLDPVATARGYNFSAALTVRNHSYLPMNQEGRPADHHHLILYILSEFELSHPELKITSWSIEQKTQATNGYIYGLWVNHEPATPHP